MSLRHSLIKTSVVLTILALCLLIIFSVFQIEQKSQLVFGYSLLNPSDNVILGLYDSSEKRTRKNNEIKTFLQGPLEAMGFRVEYHNIQNGPPSKNTMQNIRGIVTWFKEPQMKNAGAYCQWLAQQLASGKKAVIFDNFGAYQDSKTQEWTDMNIVNSVFKQLGVTYKANWTDEDNLLEIVYEDTAVVGANSDIDLTLTKHYYLFEKSDDKVRPILTIRRKDLEHSESQIIFTHPNGGMVLSRYLMVPGRTAGQESPNINLSLFLQESLFPETARNFAKEQKVLIVWNEAEDKGKKNIKGLIRTLEQAKIDFDIVELKNFEKLLIYDLERYNSLTFLTEDLWAIENQNTIQAMKEYVKNGGGLFVAMRGMNERLMDVLGVKESSQFYKKDIGGLKITTLFFPGSNELSYSAEDISHSSLRVQLEEDTHVLAVAVEKDNMHPEGIPIIWLKKYGKGNVVFWNTNAMSIVSLRGLLLQSLILSQQVGVFSLANIEIIQVDDFPRPMYNMVKDPVTTTDTEFYMNVWWPDIVALAKKHGIRYSFYAVFNYDAKTAPPFDSKEFEAAANNGFRESAQRIVEHNFELGLHGYNHQSMTLRAVDYEGWKNKRFIDEAMKQTAILWKENFPETDPPFSYVAPMNVIDGEGKAALHKIFPSIKVIGRLFTTEEERFQEFGEDPQASYFFDIPRISAGYLFDQKTKNSMINSLGMLGVWTHFFHPDDIYGTYTWETERITAEASEVYSSWESMLASIDSLFQFARGMYPWLRNMSTKDAYYEFLKYFADKRKAKIKNNLLTMSFSSGSGAKKYFAVKINSEKNISKTNNCKLIYSYPDLNLNIFESESSEAGVELQSAE